MIRVGDTIRMTDKEKEDFRAMTGRPEVPGTVAEYNRMLDTAIADWEGTACPEGQLLAAMSRDMKISADS